jgi:hypothetical protein
MQLSDYIGREILLKTPLIDGHDAGMVRILGVEAGGVWIESKALTNLALETAELESASGKPAFFVPYHALTLGVVFVKSAGQADSASNEEIPCFPKRRFQQP